MGNGYKVHHIVVRGKGLFVGSSKVCLSSVEKDKGENIFVGRGTSCLKIGAALIPKFKFEKGAW